MIKIVNKSQLTANEKFFCSHLKKEIINVITEQDDTDSADIEEMIKNVSKGGSKNPKIK